MPLAGHAAMLLIVVVLAGAYVGSRSSFIPDEGALIIQARMLARGDGWIEHPRLLHDIDPSGTWYPLDLTGPAADGGFAPLAQHPVYSLTAAGLYRLGGVKAIVAFSILGGWAAALVAAAIAKRFDQRLTVPVLWIVGLASPLFFDSFLAEGHSVGAALCGGAILAMISSCAGDDPRRRSHLGGAASGTILRGAVTVGMCLFLAALFRNEAVIFGLSLTIVSLGYSIRMRRMSLAAFGFAALAGPYLARRVEHMMQARILGRGAGRSISLVVTNQGQSLIGARASGFFHTWLEPSHLPAPGGDILILGLFAVIPFVVMTAVNHRNDALVVALAGGVMATAISRLLVHPYVAVPGLLMAFPLLWAGAWVLRPRILGEAPLFCLLAVAIFFGGVVLSQPPVGGALEWGGRYFALGLPVLVPVVMVACIRAPWTVSRTSRAAIVASAASVSLAFALLAAISLHHEKSDNHRLVSEIERVSSAQGANPVIVSVVPWLGRLSWSIYDKTQMLYVPPGDLGMAARRLRDAGVQRLTFVSFTNTDYASFMTGWNRTSTENFTAKARYWTVDRLTAGAREQ